MKIFAFPPVAPRLWEWTVVDPVQSSRSLLTGARYASAGLRRRRHAVVEVHGRRDGHAAGYMESLKELLRGGVHGVRLQSQPINWHLQHTQEKANRQNHPLVWKDGSVDLNWTDGAQELVWRDGRPMTGTTGADGVWPAVTVSGCVANQLVARPSEFLTLYDGYADAVGVTVRVLAPAYSDANGVAVVRLHDALPAAVEQPVSLGSSETAVFEAIKIPRAPQPVGGDWSFRWEFAEIFADEVGGFEDLDPWR